MCSTLPTPIQHPSSQTALQPSINQDPKGRALVGRQTGPGVWGLGSQSRFGHLEVEVKVCHRALLKYRGSRLCRAMAAEVCELAWYKGDIRDSQNFVCCGCFPGDLDAHSPAPAAASSEEVTCQRRNITCPFFILVKKAGKSCKQGRMRSTGFKSKPKCLPVPFHSGISTLLHLVQLGVLTCTNAVACRDNSPNAATERAFP